jgi:hypothetical protein
LRYTALKRDSPIVKIQSKRKTIVKIGGMTPKIGEFIFKPSPVVLDGVKIW